MEIPWDSETNSFFLVHKIPQPLSKAVSWANDTFEMSSSASEFNDEQSLDDVHEMHRHKRQKRNRKGCKGAFLGWVQSHKCETIALVILLFGLIIVPISVLAYLRDNENTTEAASAEEAITPVAPPTGKTFNDSANTDAPAASTPVSTPTAAPAMTPTSNGASPITVPTTVPSSLRPQLVDELGHGINSLLDDPNSPQNMAYNWIMEQDEMRWDNNYPTIVQRFLLATFYFATGGRLTTASWNVCSAVPENQVQLQMTNSFNTKCVSENDRRVCARFEDFENCPEYYERFDLEVPANPKKRWLSWTNECDWYGIVCDQQGLVTEISLPKNGLTGSLVSEVSFLGRVTNLNLRENELTGTLPAWTSWKYLQHLSLSDNALQGQIPSEWQDWTWLETLDLANNQISGSLELPNKWINLNTLILGGNSLYIALSESLGTAKKLEILDLHGNTLSSEIPLSLRNLRDLVEFNIAGCGVTGTIPSAFPNIPKLVDLQLQDNGFYGMIPDEVWGLTDLEILRLEDNQLSGTLSSNIGNLVNLEEFRLSRTGLEGYLPEELSNLRQLERAHLEFNDFKGSVPKELCYVSTLIELTADCTGSKKVKCDCCTKCCDKKDETCHDPEATGKSAGKRRF